MGGGRYFTLGVSVAVALLLCIIGITQWRSIHPVTFYSGEEPPKDEEITDIRAYNRKHGLMWITVGLLIVLGWFLADLAQNGIIWMVMLIAPLLGMPLYHSHLDTKYRKRP
ncbi:MAG: hypothetical protein K6G61_09725 [Solobacterium sp.]|nr:hypothetical protein [Solobacterium sp.]